MAPRPLRHLAIIAALAGGLGLAACGDQKPSRDTLVIGITQYPATLNPNIESMLAKTYVLAMTRRGSVTVAGGAHDHTLPPGRIIHSD